jgi:hypothetical protein
MRPGAFICAAIVAAMVPAAASADDPRDPAMRNAAARARDSDLTRQLNLEVGARVRDRDARNMRGLRAGRDSGGYEAAADNYAARSQDYERDMTDYNRSRAQYEHDMAAWRRAVAACREGDYSACDN